MKKIILPIGLFLLVFASCTFKKGEVPIVVTAPKCDSTVHYANTIVSIINNNCATSGCHDARSGRDYTNYNALYAKVTNGSLINRVYTLKTMPQAPATLSDADIQRIYCWATQGGQNN